MLTALVAAQFRCGAVVEIEEINKRTCLVVTELPYQVNPDNLALKIAELVKDGKIKGIADVRDEGNERLRTAFGYCSSQ
jgi:DNA gyrase subunit A